VAEIEPALREHAFAFQGQDFVIDEGSTVNLEPCVVAIVNDQLCNPFG